MSEKTRTTVYLMQQDRDRLERLKTRYGLGVSAAVRAGLALLERQMKGDENMTYTIGSDKLAQVVKLFNEQVDTEATDDLVEREITADWNEGDEHQKWIDNAPAQEIVDWLASFYD